MEEAEENRNVAIDFDCVLDVEFTIDDPRPEGKYYPVTLKKALFRGKDIMGIMHIGHIMTLQRRVYNHLIDQGEDLECLG